VEQASPKADGAASSRANGRATGPSRVGRQAHESRLYDEFSPLYDLVFARVFFPRIGRVVRSLKIPPGARVLEVGVGTGLSLGAYPPRCEVTGLDRSEAMLEHAQRKIEKHGWHHVRLVCGDAMALPFPDASFDYVNVFHVITVVPDYVRLLEEAKRVLRPGGTLVVINHFRSDNRWLSAVEKRFEFLTRRWGWHTLSREDVVSRLGAAEVRAWKDRPTSLFTTVLARTRPASGNGHA
jgi:phosphatidylethanolamine/phosphatidyl-N-methylethanolamine N-methyltransferase